jgi:seryl-tRNA(Sec) selenium transferase
MVECCSTIAEAEAAVSVNENKWLVMHMHVQLKQDELRGPPNPWLTMT